MDKNQNTLCSLGLDVGTTTTQLILSRLTVENRASAFAVPEISITNREILYRSPVYFTPLLSESRMDGDGIRKIVEKEYAAAGITPAQVDTGAILITGESSRKENAGRVLTALSHMAGEFVAAAAGPDLESVLAAKGAGAVAYSRDTGKTVLHMDIGGGTSNLALISRGKILATGCLNIGGRLIKRDNKGTVTYVSPVLRGITSIQLGDTPSEEEIHALAKVLAQVLEAAAGFRPAVPLLPKLTTEGTAPLPLAGCSKNIVCSFSGGVADCILNSLPGNAFGDMGPALGSAIRESLLCAGEYRLGAETIRATVIGAGCYSAQLSGSTVFAQNMPLPLKNLPVTVLEDIPATLPEEAIYALGIPVPDYAALGRLADALARAAGKRLMVCLEQDAAQALGQALARRLGTDTQLLCLDGIKLTGNSYLDVGQPVGPAYPVVVKTLILSQEDTA